MNEAAARVLSLAHRGASARRPENTLSAFSLAMDLDADGVELDVHETADGVFAVHHDPTLAGLALDATPFAELRRAFPGDGDRGLPRLEQVLDLLADHRGATVYVEVKGLRSAPALLAALAPRRRELALNVQSFDRGLLGKIAAANAALPAAERFALGVIARDAGPGTLRALDDCGATVLSLRRDALAPGLADGLHAAGRRLAAWTVNDDREIRAALALGVDAVISDRPDRVAAVLAGFGA